MTRPTDFATNTVPNSAPLRLVEFSRTALNSNLDRLVDIDSDAVIDLRCDAYGHGADWVEDAARSRGFVSFIDDDSEQSAVSSSHTIYDRVATVHGEIVALKTVPLGESVSYGYTWSAERDSTVALVSLGFADGIPRGGSNRCHVTLADSRVPIIGRIAMDQFVIDATNVTATVGDRVSLWGTPESIREWSDASAREPLSLVAGLTWRVERSWIE